MTRFRIVKRGGEWLAKRAGVGKKLWLTLRLRHEKQRLPRSNDVEW